MELNTMPEERFSKLRTVCTLSVNMLKLCLYLGFSWKCTPCTITTDFSRLYCNSEQRDHRWWKIQVTNSDLCDWITYKSNFKMVRFECLLQSHKFFSFLITALLCASGSDVKGNWYYTCWNGSQVLSSILSVTKLLVIMNLSSLHVCVYYRHFSSVLSF
jgi:hypothetical protein